MIILVGREKSTMGCENDAAKLYLYSVVMICRRHISAMSLVVLSGKVDLFTVGN